MATPKKRPKVEEVPSASDADSDKFNKTLASLKDVALDTSLSYAKRHAVIESINLLTSINTELTLYRNGILRRRRKIYEDSSTHREGG